MAQSSKRGKRRTRSLPFVAAINRISELRNQPDHIAAIVAGTILEGALEKSLAGRMRRMTAKDHNEIFHSGPLRNFQPKILLGQALSLYGPNTTKELQVLADIRNSFAHTVRTVTFDFPAIKKKCFTLKRCDMRAPAPFFSILVGEPLLDMRRNENSRCTVQESAKLRFLFSGMILVYMLESTADDRPTRGRAPWPGFFG